MAFFLEKKTLHEGVRGVSFYVRDEVLRYEELGARAKG